MVTYPRDVGCCVVRVALFIRELTLKGGFKAGWEGGSLMTKVEPKGWGCVL